MGMTEVMIIINAIRLIIDLQKLIRGIWDSFKKIPIAVFPLQMVINT